MGILFILKIQYILSDCIIYIEREKDKASMCVTVCGTLFFFLMSSDLDFSIREFIENLLLCKK